MAAGRLKAAENEAFVSLGAPGITYSTTSPLEREMRELNRRVDVGVRWSTQGVGNVLKVLFQNRLMYNNYKKRRKIMKSLIRIVKMSVCTVLITSLMGCAATQKQSSTGGYVDDTVITTKVKSAIFEDPALKVFQINVKTFKGDVQLSGFVNSPASISKAGEIARSVNGVKSVNNDLIVK